jgi:hypothetical protein
MKRTKTTLLRVSSKVQTLPNFYTCVVYFSLPSFPKSCSIVTNHDVVIRDLLLCNRINDHHIKGGMQYDPNVENAEYRVCEGRIRRGLQKRLAKYDNLYILFRTRFFELSGASRYLVTGYYHVGTFQETDYSDTPIVRASDMRFVSLSDCIDITGIVKKRSAFRCCFNSENEDWAPHLESWFCKLNRSPNRTDDYVNQINALKTVFFENEVQGNNYVDCPTCANNARCPLMWRLSHRTITSHPANYMRNLDEYFKSIMPEDRTPIT